MDEKTQEKVYIETAKYYQSLDIAEQNAIDVVEKAKLADKLQQEVSNDKTGYLKTVYNSLGIRNQKAK